MKSARQKSNVAKKIGSLAFYLAIPCGVFLSTVGIITLLTLVQKDGLSKEIVVVFLISFLSGLIFFASAKLAWFRTFVHELKHAAVVRLSGNKVTDFYFEEESGHVSYQMYADRTHFGPFICLAPYFFPLFSLPVFFICLIFNKHYQFFLIFLLGFTLAIDLVTGYQEFHPRQTDLQRIFGGLFIAFVFIGIFHCAWFLTCLLWIVGGREAFLHAGFAAATLLRLFTEI